MFSFFPFVKFIIGFIEYTFDNYQSLKSPTGNSNILQFHYKLGREIIFYLKNILISHPICYKSVYWFSIYPSVFITNRDSALIADSNVSADEE